MKKLYRSLLLFVLASAYTLSSMGQCSLTTSYWCCFEGALSGTTDRTLGGFSPGTYFYFAVLSGGSYAVSTCGAPFDTEISLWDPSGSTSIGYNDDNGPYCSGLNASINFVPSFSNYARTQITEYHCGASGPSSISVYIHQNNNLTITSSGANMCSGQTRVLTATPAAVSSPGGIFGDGGTFTGTGVSGPIFTAPSVSSPTTYTITYTFGFVRTTQNITVYPAPGTISGTFSICAGSATTLTNSSAGGTWSSSNTSVATINSTSGSMGGVAAGTATISYIEGCGSYTTHTVNINSLPGTISGTFAVCQGSGTTLSTSGSGGSWTSSNTGVATINLTSGAMGGVSAGTATISYSTVCGNATATVTVNPATSAGSISGASTVCEGATTALTTTGTGGSWSSSNTSVATITSGGIVTGVAAGTSLISYSVSGSCGTGVATQLVSVTPIPGTISGTLSVCPGATSLLSNTVTGGSWSSSDMSIATIDASSGMVSAVSAGTATITYSNGCGTPAMATFTVNTPPTMVTVGGAGTFCGSATITATGGTGGTIYFQGTTSGGTSTGTPSTSEVITSSGTYYFRAMSAAGCWGPEGSVVIVINSSAGPITGASFVCSGLTISLSSSPAGGTWSSSNTAVATMGMGTGIATGVATGTAIITYSVGSGCTSVTTLTVVSPAPITGTASVNAGSSTTLSNVNPGGTWSSGNTAVATVVSGTGVVGGVAGGTSVITYLLATGCQSTITVTVNIVAGPITGATTICSGTTTALTNPTSGGTWSSSNTSVATVGTTSGILSGVSDGTSTITYTVGTSTATFVMTIIGAPVITSMSVSSGYPSSSVTLTGTNFNTSSANNIVYFGATHATVSSASATSVNVTVPSEATYQPVTAENTTCFLTAWSQFPYLPSYDNSAYAANTVHFSSKVDFAAATNPFGVAIGDIDGDGNADLAVVNYGSNSVSVYRNTATSGSITSGSFAAKVDFTTGAAPQNVAIADIDGDGKLDVVAVNNGASTVSILRNTASSGSITSGSLAAKVDFATGSGPVCVAIGDLDMDGKADLVVANYGANTMSVLRNISTSGAITTGSFATKVDFATGVHPFAVALGDIDGDGKKDIALTNQGAAALSLFRNTSVIGSITSTSLGSRINFTTGTNPSGLAIGDIDGDGKLDVAVANNGAATVSLFRNTATSGTIGIGSLSTKTDFATGTGAYWVAMGDVNGDGKVDVAVTNSTANTVSVFRNTATSGTIGLGTLAAKADYGVGAAPRVVAIGDLDGDGMADIATANISANTVSILRNDPIGLITGSLSICGATATTALADATAGGNWSSSNTAVATVGVSTGIVTGVAPGTAIISYTISGQSTTVTVTVGSGSTITGTTSACVGDITTLSNSTSGGAWSSGTTSVATIDGSGNVTGVSAGTSVISYATSGCIAMTTVTINPTPAAISGSLSICAGTSTTLTDATGSGSWTSSTTSVATIVGTTGVARGVTAGTSIISYRIASGCYTTAVMTVNPLPSAITGTASVCVGMMTTLTGSGSGTWTSSNTSVATIDMSSGDVAGVLAGTSLITYNLGTGCFVTRVVTVNPTPAAIGGTMSLCQGSTTTLTGTGGGSWTSSDASIATIGISSGIVNGVAAGTTLITYTLATGCYTTAVVAVNPLPATISGPSSICVFGSATLTDAITGGSWTTSNASVATIGLSSGFMFGSSAGTAIITYTLPTGCRTTQVVTVTPPPAAITGTMTVCSGSMTTLGDATGGGNWSSSDGSIATVGTSTGIVSGVMAGTVTITYASGSGCYSTAVVTVNPTPAAITGSLTVCLGTTTSLSDLTGSGVWSSTNTAAATITSGGLVTGVAAPATSTISYTLAGCAATAVVSVSPLPGAISGGSTVCSGSSITLTDGTSGGAWTSSNTSVATADPSTGDIFGVTGGTVTITYTAATSCYVTKTVTVSSGPSAITGSTNLCGSSTTTLSNATAGGTWSSSNTAVASIGSTTGMVAGLTNGTAVITYTIACGIATTTVTVGGTPVITSLSSSMDTVLATVTITGNTFNTVASSNIVYFGATMATVSAASATSLTVTVPVGATFKTVSVENTGCMLTAYAQYPFLPSYNNSAYINTTIVLSSKVDFVSGTNPFNIALGDIDGDGKADMVATNYSSNTISVYRNTSTSGTITSGSFAAKVDFATGASPYGITIGDLDGDGKLDIVVTNNTSAPPTVSVYRNTATSGSITSGSLAAKVDFGVGAGPIGAAIVDVDKDGRPEIVVANNGANTISVLRNTSTSGSITSGSFAAKVDFVSGSHPYGVVFGDIDGDGKQDMVVPNQAAASVSVFRNTATTGAINSSSFATKVDFTAGSQPYNANVADIDGDGKLDVITANNAGNSVSVLRNTATSGTITSGSLASKVDFTTGSGPYCVSVGDINGDGKADLVTANSTGNSVSVLRNTATSGTITSGSFAAKTDFTTGSAPRSVAVGDLDGDFKADIATANISSNNVSVLRNNPTLHPTPGGVTTAGMVTICVGASVSVADGTAEGTFTTADSKIAIVNEATGIVTGMSAGRTVVRHAFAGNVTTTTVVVNALPDAVYIVATPGTNVKKGQIVKFVAAVQNGGTNPVYQWLLNGVVIPGAVNADYTSNDLADNDVVTCKVGSGSGCGDYSIANNVIMHVQNADNNSVITGSTDIRLTPNPNSGDFTVKGSLAVTLDQEVSVEITDMLGQVIYRGSITAKAGRIDQQIKLTGSLANGMYVLTLRSGDENKMFHFAISR